MKRRFHRTRLLTRLIFSLAMLLGVIFIGHDLYIPDRPENAGIRSAGPVTETDVTSGNHTYHVFRATLGTDDFRTLEARLIIPDKPQGDLPLIVISAAFLKFEDVLPALGIIGNNAVLFYNPRDLYNMRYGISAASPEASVARVIWEALRLNPLNRWLNIYSGLHRAPGDLVRLVQWAQTVTPIDRGRVNVIGLGMGSLTASMAALALEKKGPAPRTLTLIFPPADLEATLRANTSLYQGNALFSRFSDFMLRRLRLHKTLPQVKMRKLLVIPARDIEMPTYAAEPAIALAGPADTLRRIDLKYEGWNRPLYILAIHNEVTRWLLEQQAISGY